MADHHARHLRRSLFTGVSALALALLASAPAAYAASHSTASSHKTQGTSGTSGSTSQPQPQSNADKNSGGANGQCPGGPYCSTRNGSPSLNGNGGGKGTGKPCAGLFGKADNKNPQGQKPNGTDHNAGYECDRNHGIGRSNPAHTGCKPTPTPSPSCVPTNANNHCQPPCVATAANNFCQPPCVATAANNFCQPPCVATAANNFCQPPVDCL